MHSLETDTLHEVYLTSPPTRSKYSLPFEMCFCNSTQKIVTQENMLTIYLKKKYNVWSVEETDWNSDFQ